MAKDISVVLTLDNKQFDRGIAQSEKSVSQFTRSSTAGVNRLRGALLALVSTATLKSIIQIGSKFQDLQTSLDQVFGGAQQGAKAFERINKLALKTQFGVDTLTTAFIQLKGVGIEPSEKMLLTFADTASVAVDGMGAFKSALDLVTRSAAGGLNLEELNRLGDRSIPVFAILKEKLGLAKDEISAFGKSAEGSKKILDALLEGLEERFGGTLAKKLQNVSVLFSNMTIQAEKLAVAIFDKLEPSIAKMLNDMTLLLGQMETFVLEAKDMKDVIEGIEEALGPFADLLALVVNLFGAFIALKIANVFITLGYAVKSIAVFFFTLASALMEGVKVSEALGTKFTKLSKLFRKFFLIDVALSLIESIKMIRVMEALGYTFSETLPIALKVFANSMIGTFMGTFKSVIGIAAEFYNQLKSIFSDDGFSFKEIGLRAIEDFKEGFKAGNIFEIPEEIKKAFDEADIFGNLPSPEITPIVKPVAEIDTAINTVTEKLTLLQMIFAKVGKEIQTNFLNVIKSATSTLSDDLAKGLMEGKNALESFQSFFKTVITKLISDAIRLSIIQPIISGIFGALVPGKTLSFTDGIPSIGAKAKGGPVSANTPYMVGEQGPELFTPRTNGNIIPNGAGGGSVTNNNNYITNNISAMDSRSVAQVFAENRQALLGTVEYARKETSYGM
tara:strand:- start:1118 stop:3139 length:2022 start_codon:yes stop_codon:yes gene_type:complete